MRECREPPCVWGLDLPDGCVLPAGQDEDEAGGLVDGNKRPEIVVDRFVHGGI